MTGYTVHTGSTEKFSEGWDQIFSGQRKKPAKKAATSQKPQSEPKSKTSKKPKKST